MLASTSSEVGQENVQAGTDDTTGLDVNGRKSDSVDAYARLSAGMLSRFQERSRTAELEAQEYQQAFQQTTVASAPLWGGMVEEARPSHGFGSLMGRQK